MNIIELAMLRSRTVVLSLLIVLVGGIVAYLTIPKEAEPDIEIPVIHINIEHDARRSRNRPVGSTGRC